MTQNLKLLTYLLLVRLLHSRRVAAGVAEKERAHEGQAAAQHPKPLRAPPSLLLHARSCPFSAPLPPSSPSMLPVLYVCIVPNDHEGGELDQVKETDERILCSLCHLPPSSLPPHHLSCLPKPRTSCPAPATPNPRPALVDPAIIVPEDKRRIPITLEEEGLGFRKEAAATTPCLPPLAAARRRLDAICAHCLASPFPLRPVQGCGRLRGQLL